jgi:hypothetical protein
MIPLLTSPQMVYRVMQAGFALSAVTGALDACGVKVIGRPVTLLLSDIAGIWVTGRILLQKTLETSVKALEVQTDLFTRQNKALEEHGNQMAANLSGLEAQVGALELLREAHLEILDEYKMENRKLAKTVQILSPQVLPPLETQTATPLSL